MAGMAGCLCNPPLRQAWLTRLKNSKNTQRFTVVVFFIDVSVFGGGGGAGVKPPCYSGTPGSSRKP